VRFEHRARALGAQDARVGRRGADVVLKTFQAVIVGAVGEAERDHAGGRVANVVMAAGGVVDPRLAAAARRGAFEAGELGDQLVDVQQLDPGGIEQRGAGAVEL
jgi:hypothetical protein